MALSTRFQAHRPLSPPRSLRWLGLGLGSGLGLGLGSRLSSLPEVAVATRSSASLCLTQTPWRRLIDERASIAEAGSLHVYMGLQPAHVRLPPPPRGVAASATWGCNLQYMGLQPHLARRSTPVAKAVLKSRKTSLQRNVLITPGSTSKRSMRQRSAAASAGAHWSVAGSHSARHLTTTSSSEIEATLISVVLYCSRSTASACHLQPRCRLPFLGECRGRPGSTHLVPELLEAAS